MPSSVREIMGEPNFHAIKIVRRQ